MKSALRLFGSWILGVQFFALLATPAFAAGPPRAERVPGEVIVKFAGAGPALVDTGNGAGGQYGGKLRGYEKSKTAPGFATVLERRGLIGAEPLVPSRKFVGQRRRGAPNGAAEEPSNLHRLVFPADADIDAIIVELKQSGGVVYAEPNFAGSLCFAPSDPLYSQQSADLALIGIENAWTVQPGANSSVKVAVIDSGVEAGHPDLSGALDVANSYNFVDSNTNIFDDIGHGTRVAGIIGASGNNGEGIAGIAFGCKIMSLDVTDTTGAITTTRVVNALNWAVSHGAQIANMSLRFTGFSQTLKDACDDASAAGVLLIAAAGNENQGDAPVYPASFDSVVGVGALMDNGTARAPWSNYDGSNSTIVKLVAPGETVFSAIPGSQYNGTYGSGTSFAAPMVAGTAALLKAKYPTQSAGAIKQHLVNTAQPVGGGFSPAGGAGHGKLSASTALQTAMTPALSVASVSVDDSTAYSGSNNNDGTLDKGETVVLKVSLKNDGADAATVTGTLATTDGLITLSDTSGAWGMVANGATQGATDYFTTVTLSAASTAHQVPFTIGLSANGGSYTQTASLNVAAENTVSIGQGSYFALQTWSSGNTYEVSGTQNFNGGLTVQPGTTIKIKPGVNLNINAGTLTMVGTSDQPINVTSLTPSTTIQQLKLGPHTTPVNLSAYDRLRYVDAIDGSDAGGTGSIGSPWRTIKYAVSQITDASSSIRYALLVGRGTYTDTNTNITSYIDAYGGYDPPTWSRDIFSHRTVIDTNYLGRGISVSTNAGLDGFWVTHGRQSGNYGLGIGCANSGTSVTNNIVIGNRGNGDGTGIDRGSYVANNLVAYNDEGMTPAFSYAIIGGNVVISNSGCGIDSRNLLANSIITNNIVQDNTNSNTNNGSGIGISMIQCANPIYCTNNLVIGNSMTATNNSSGAIYVYLTTAQVFNNVVVDNLFYYSGNGGIISSSPGTSAIVTNNIVRGNTPNQINTIAGGSVSVDFNDAQGYGGNASNIDADPGFVGSVLWGTAIALSYDNELQETLLTCGEQVPAPAIVTNSVVTINSKPFFVASCSGAEMRVIGDVTAGGTIAAPVEWRYKDYHILPSSPCIDMGTNTGAPYADVDGLARPVNGGSGLVTDIGSDEYDPAQLPFYSGGEVYVQSGVTGSVSHASFQNIRGLRNQAANVQFSECAFVDNASDGLNSSAGTGMVTSCTAAGNLLGGIVGGSRPLNACASNFNLGGGASGAALTSCSAYANVGVGLLGSSGTGCVAQSNSATGLTCSGSIAKCSALDNLGKGLACTSGNVADSAAFRNGLDGISLSGGGTASNCTSSQNRGKGIVTDGSTVDNCAVTSNSGDGVSGSGSSILSNSSIAGNGGTAATGVATISNSRLVGNGGGASGATSINNAYIAANSGAGAIGGAINSSTIVGNLGVGSSASTSLNNSWVIFNTNGGVDSPTGNVTFCSIRSNGSYGARNVPGAKVLNSCNLYGNGTYDYYDNLNNAPGGYPLDVKDCRFNYWGSASTAEMSSNPFPSVSVSRIYDEFDNGLANGWYANYGASGEFATFAVPSAPNSTPPAFLLDVVPNTSNAVNVGFTTFTLTFSKAMNTAMNPAVTFGKTSPYESHVVEASPGWLSTTTWQGAFWVQSDTGNGLNTLKVSNATASDSFVIPDDTSHQFTIDTTGGGSANNGVVVSVGAQLSATWSENGKDPTALGYNVRRSSTGTAGSYQKVNGAVVTSPQFVDSTTNISTLYFYIVDVVDSQNNSTQWTPPFYAVSGVPVGLSRFEVE